jgi:cobalt-zinc-cadmium efflux system protein
MTQATDEHTHDHAGGNDHSGHGHAVSADADRRWLTAAG